MSGPAPGGDLHIAWTRFQRRQLSLAHAIGVECVFLARARGHGLAPTVVDYLGLFRRTLGLLRTRQPRMVWIQLPPAPLLWAALAYRRWCSPGTRVVADCHNAMFGPRWSRVPFGLSCLGRCDLVVVHNERMRAPALAAGVSADRLLVLEDRPAVPDTPALGSAALPHPLQGLDRPWVLAPGSFGTDEPVEVLLGAARLLKDCRFILTGRISNARRHGHDLSELPPNVRLTDYLEQTDFDAVLQACDVVLALTRTDGVQLSICNEALGFGKAMVMSDTSLLRELFGSAAVLVDSGDACSVADGVRRALEQRGPLEAAAQQLAAARMKRFEHQLAQAPTWLRELVRAV